MFDQEVEERFQLSIDLYSIGERERERLAGGGGGGIHLVVSGHFGHLSLSNQNRLLST